MSEQLTRPAYPVFAGNRRTYRKLALLMGLASHLYLYAGMVLIVCGVRGETWILDGKAIVITLFSSLLLSGYSYRSFCLLDAQIGKGGRWQLSEYRVKLPELRRRR